MQSVISHPPESQFPSFPVDRQLEDDHQRECRKLNDLAFTFFNAVDGDVAEAEKLLDAAIDLLLEGGVLQLWRYRILLNQIREGL